MSGTSLCLRRRGRKKWGRAGSGGETEATGTEKWPLVRGLVLNIMCPTLKKQSAQCSALCCVQNAWCKVLCYIWQQIGGVRICKVKGKPLIMKRKTMLSESAWDSFEGIGSWCPAYILPRGPAVRWITPMPLRCKTLRPLAPVYWLLTAYICPCLSLVLCWREPPLHLLLGNPQLISIWDNFEESFRAWIFLVPPLTSWVLPACVSPSRLSLAR